MRTSELRIGNLVQWNNDKNQIELVNVINMVAIGLSSDIIFDTLTPILSFKPIPLTEEWLLKFGFEFYEGEMIGETSMNDNWTKDLFKIDVWGNGYLFYWDDKFDNRIKYVHQFQNLYFALTGNELIILK